MAFKGRSSAVAYRETLIDGVSRVKGPIMNTVLSKRSYNVRVRI